MGVSRVFICALSLVGQAQAVRSKRNSQQAEAVTVQGVKVHNYKENNKEWVVFFKAETHDSTIKDFCHGKCDFQGHPDRKGSAFAKFYGSEEELEERLTGRSDVDLIESDEIDSLIPDIESSELASWGLKAIGVESRPTTGRGVHIYVTDTGIRTSHQDFGGRAVSALDMSSGREIVCSGRVSCADDKQGHGSHCAGTAAGTTFGVAPDAKVYAVKTLSDQGTGQRSWQYEGIDFVASSGKTPSVLSMSLGGKGTDPGYDRVLGAAVDAGVTIVVAAGNSNADACGFNPAFSSFAITVGATDRRNKRASYSNFGKCNDIMAPGSGIVSVGVNSDTGERILSGTSMACPHVSGAAALLLETNPSLTKDQILRELKATAVQNLISGLKEDDPNYFLWVSSKPADSPAPPPTCPSFASQERANDDGDCQCPGLQECHNGSRKSCPCFSHGLCAGAAGTFKATCTTCRCVEN